MRRECVDHIIVLGEAHLRQVLNLTLAITTNLELTCRWTRMRHCRVRFRSAAALLPALFLADYTINTAGSVGEAIELKSFFEWLFSSVPVSVPAA